MILPSLITFFFYLFGGLPNYELWWLQTVATLREGEGGKLLACNCSGAATAARSEMHPESSTQSRNDCLVEISRPHVGGGGGRGRKMKTMEKGRRECSVATLKTGGGRVQSAFKATFCPHSCRLSEVQDVQIK